VLSPGISVVAEGMYKWWQAVRTLTLSQLWRWRTVSTRPKIKVYCCTSQLSQFVRERYVKDSLQWWILTCVVHLRGHMIIASYLSFFDCTLSWWAQANFFPDLRQTDIPNGFPVKQVLNQVSTLWKEKVLEIFEKPVYAWSSCHRASSWSG
jgi:hypothetical protein